MKQKSPIILALVIILIAFISYVAAFGLNLGGYRIKSLGSAMKKGLDLKGGVYVVEEIQDQNVTPETIDRTIVQIKERMDKYGVVDPTVVREGNRIRIEIPGMYDQTKALEYIGKTGYLKFVGPDNVEILNGKNVKNSYVSFDEYNQPVVSLEFDEEGAKKFDAATQKFLGKEIAIYLDEDEISHPTVQAHITQGKAIIQGMKDQDEAKRVATLIKAGSLPVTLKPANVKTIGPTLGADALQRSVLAGMVGIGLVLIFMLLYYKLPGLIADLALIVFIVLTLFIFVLFNVTLTLPGISGFLLTIGMAVDANVLIFERMREELKTGKTLHAALTAGFDRALTAIIDSNVTTIIAGVVLALLGTGSVKGFAITLIIGILTSMFTAVVVTRFLLNLVINIKSLAKPKYFGA